jgi:hypothetical protein
MSVEEIRLTELQYSKQWRGPLGLYIYENDGFHRGGKWFREKPKYPDEEISKEKAILAVKIAMEAGKEIRITDGGDEMVFHAKGGKVLFPNNPEQFWAECGK